jgi:hypothetical protein
VKFNVNESKLLFLVSIAAPAGDPVAIRPLAIYYERPCHLDRARDSLRAFNFIAYDPFTDMARLIVPNILNGLRSAGPVVSQAQLFPNERPLDAALASVGSVKLPARVLNSHARSAISHTHDNMPTCNWGSTELHANMTVKPERLHEVGELSGRTTLAIMADIRRLAPKLDGENLYRWQERIEKESAENVNAVVRQCSLQRKTIKNPAGWMNANYLKLVNGTTSKGSL